MSLGYSFSTLMVRAVNPLHRRC